MVEVWTTAPVAVDNRVNSSNTAIDNNNNRARVFLSLDIDVIFVFNLLLVGVFCFCEPELFRVEVCLLGSNFSAFSLVLHFAGTFNQQNKQNKNKQTPATWVENNSNKKHHQQSGQGVDLAKPFSNHQRPNDSQNSTQTNTYRSHCPPVVSPSRYSRTRHSFHC